MAFWGCSLKAGQKEKVEVSAADVLHLSQVCLHQPGAGKSYLQVQVNGKTYTIGCLEKDKVETLALDLFFSEGPTFVNTGKSEVHLSGYTEPRGTGEEYLDEDGESSDEPPAKKAALAPAKAAASPKAAKAASPKAAPAPAKAKAAEDDEDEESEEEEGEESEEEAAPAPKAKAKAKAKAEAAKQAEDDEDEESEEEEDEEEEEKAPPAKAPAAKKGKEPAATPDKRKAAEAAAPAAKKAKAGDAPASPKAAAAAASGDEDGYLKALVDYLKKNGKAKLSDLGSKVKRPEGVPKMKAMFTKHASKFALDGEVVSLK